MTPANRLTAEILLAVSREFPDVKAWRSNVIAARAVGKDGRQRIVKAGIRGQADISGIVGPNGTRLEVEVKIPPDIQSVAQIVFEKMITRAGGIYIIARNLEGTLRTIGHHARRVRPERDHQEPGE